MVLIFAITVAIIRINNRRPDESPWYFEILWQVYEARMKVKANK